MAADGEDLDLLLSLRDDRVLETPPQSPSPSDGSPRRRPRLADMSIFRDAVKDYLDTDPSPSIPAASTVSAKSKSKKPKKSDEVIVEKFSGLKIRNLMMSQLEINNQFSDIRFVQLRAIKNLGDNISGNWATVGVLVDKGPARVSSAGKSYSIWKIGSLDESDLSVFLFGDSHTQFSGETIGAVFAFFNCAIRRDSMGKGYSLSVYSSGQMQKIGISADYGVCKGKRKDGLTCTMVINKRKGAYCKFHKEKATQKYSTGRAELKGGNLHTAFKFKPEGIFMVDPLSKPRNSSLRKPFQPVKVMSVDGLKKALSKADKVTSNKHSQGIRFLSHITSAESKIIPRLNKGKSAPVTKIGSKRSAVTNNEPESKREKTDKTLENMIELDYVSSDGD